MKSFRPADLSYKHKEMPNKKRFGVMEPDAMAQARANKNKTVQESKSKTRLDGKSRLDSKTKLDGKAQRSQKSLN